jgi:GntR family transcriptional repressor for pyruvate dehydrogenase complex
MPPHRTPLSETIFTALRDGILSGRPAPGEPLASERVLADELGCNRHAVREAVKRLQQAGLVAVSHGGATRVLDWRASGGLDLLAQLPLAAGDAEHVRSVLELRLCVGVDAARRCAQRAPAPTLAALRATLEEDDDDPRDAPLRYAALWDRIIDGSDNLAYRLAYNSLLATLDPGGEPSRSLFAAETTDARAHHALVAAIAAADPDAAADAAADLLARALAPATEPARRG